MFKDLELNLKEAYKKHKNINYLLMVLISFLMILGCIYISGIHTNHFYFIFIFLVTITLKRNSIYFLKGTFIADLVLSFFFLSFSWVDYAGFSVFRERAFSMATLYPSITIFILIVYYSVLSEEEFKINKFLNKQTYFPLISILIGFSSGITTAIHPNLGIISTIHLLSIFFFIFLNFFLIYRYFKDSYFILRLSPISFYLFTILVSKSKVAIILTLSLIFIYTMMILIRKKIFKSFFLKKLLKYISNTLIFTLAFSIILINILSFNIYAFDFYPNYIDNLTTNRLSINSSFINGLKEFKTEKIRPQFFPNKEYKVVKNLNQILKNKNFLEIRYNSLAQIKAIDKRNIITSLAPHNAFLYFQILHRKIWNYLLYILIFLISINLLIQYRLSSIFYLIIFMGPLVFENLSYLNALMLIISSYFLIHFSEIKFKKKVIFNK